VSRVEAETKTVRQVGADLLRLQERLEAEKGTRESELGQLRSEIHEVLGNRNVTDEKFQVGTSLAYEFGGCFWAVSVVIALFGSTMLFCKG
jgi:hypothetical protein